MSKNRRISATFWGPMVGAFLVASASAAQVVAPPTPAVATPATPKVIPNKAAPAIADVVVTNSRAVALTELFVSPAGSPKGTKIAVALAPGGSYVARIAHDKECLFDLRADYEDGSSTDAVSLALCRDKKINLVDPVVAANVVEGGIRPQESMCDWYELDWDEMTAAEARAWSTLGWRAENWGTDNPKAEPASSSKDWDELSASERQAAQSLGFEPKTWNPDPDPCEGWQPKAPSAD